MPKLRFIHDRDPWLLGEDIPDCDLVFSQIWLSGFVNEFQEPGGIAYQKILCVYRGYHLWFYFGDHDANKVGNHIVEKFMRQPAFVTRTNREIIKWADRLRAFAETIPEQGLERLTNKALWRIYERHDAIHTKYYQWGWIPVAADMFHGNFTERMKECLRKHGVSEEKLNEYFMILTQPVQKSLIQIEQDEFLELALHISRDKYHQNLFATLYQQFRDQEAATKGLQVHTKEYEALLEERVRALHNSIKPEIMKLIQAHYVKYFYVNHMWVASPFSFEHYLKELVKLAGTFANVKAMIAKAKEERRVVLHKRQELLAKLNLAPQLRTLFDGFGDFMVTKIYRRYAQIYAMYKLEFVQKEIARRFDFSLMQVRFLLPQEMKALLLHKKIPSDLQARTRLCVYYAEKGNDTIFTGIRAEKLAEQVQRVEVGDMQELLGQTGCVGYAQGVVRLINSPNDMEKMQQGDILVSIATNPDIVPAMKKAAAIVTDQGGVTSHAAIVARELHVPCVIGTKIATKWLKDGDRVEVDATKGLIRLLQRRTARTASKKQ